MASTPQSSQAVKRCRRCGGWLTLSRSAEGPRAVCSACGAQYDLDGGRAATDGDAFWDQELADSHQPRPEEPLAEPAPPSQPQEAQWYEHSAQRFVRSTPPPPPRWTFASGVFTFPFHRATVGAWGAMSVLLALVLAIGRTVWVLVFLGMGAIVLSASLMIALAWLFVLAGGHAAACFRLVVEETAAGAEVVEGWPTANFRDWAVEIAPPLVVVGASLLPGGAATYLFELPGWEATFVTAMVAFPLFYLSALESGSWLMPYSRMVWRSTGLLAWAWALFYGLTIGVGLLLAEAFAAAAERGMYLGLLAGGPLLAAYLLIYARLLGRLAWRIERWVENQAGEEECD